MPLAGTRFSLATIVRSIVFGWFGWSIAAAVILFAGGVLLMTDDAAPLVISITCLFFAIHVVTLFIRESLESPLPLTETLPVGELLAPQLLKNVRGTEMDGVALLKAALLSARGKFLLDEMGLDAAHVHSVCGNEAENLDVPAFIRDSAQMLPMLDELRVDASLILATVFLKCTSGATLLTEADLSQEDMIGMLRWEGFRNKFRVSENAWSSSAIRRNASLGRSWVMGYTDALDSLTSEIDTSEHSCGEKSIIIHRDLIERSIRVLSKSSQKNILLLGSIGTGRRTLVRNIAAAYRKLERDNHRSFTRILLLHTEQLLSGTQSPDSFLLGALSRASSRGTFILVIPEIAQLLKSADQNLKTVLLQCLQSTAFGVIGITETASYHTLVKTDAGLDYLLEKIDVSDATDEETMQVLMAHWATASHRKVHLSYKAMRSIIDLSKRYLSPNTGMPGKAIIVMDDAIQRAAERGDSYLTEAHVREVVSVRGKVNVQKVGGEERERLINLESVLSKQVIDQPDAIHAVSGALKRARIDLGDRKRPIGTFLFLGPTGVGKTQTAKALAKEYFGSEDAMIRLDMNEYNLPDCGLDYLAQRVQDQPFSLILLDEIEKAHTSVLNLFLQILDEGFLHDANGVRTDFRNAIIIATSNAGALFIRDYVRDHQTIDKNVFKKELLDSILRDRIFSPEFVNRFDEVVLFYPLSQLGLESVAVMMLDDIITDIKHKRGIDIRLEADVIGGLVERGYSIEFGARAMRRTITDMIEDYLADYMLQHDTKRGDTIVIRKGDLKW